MITSLAVKSQIENDTSRIFPLYTQQSDFNRAERFMQLSLNFTVEDCTYYVCFRPYTETFSNDSGASTCSSHYSSVVTVYRGWLVWIVQPDEYKTKHRIEITGWVPKAETSMPNLESRSNIIPMGFYAGTSRVYLKSNGTGVYNSGVRGAPPPDIKFYREDGSYDLLTYDGNYIISTRGGDVTVRYYGSTNTSGGATYKYSTSDMYLGDYSYSDSTTNPKFNDDGYFNLEAPAKHKSVSVGHKTYNRLYLPLVTKAGAIAVRSKKKDNTVATLYYNESMITTCTAARDYTGRIICPAYGEDCLSQTATDDDIFGEGYLCDAGQDVTYDICGNGESSCSGETITTRTHIRCSGAACTTETEDVPNLCPTISQEHDTGDTSSLPTDLPEINDWIDPHSCTSQSRIDPGCSENIYCDIDGPNSETCLGRVNQLCGEKQVDSNKCGDDSYLINEYDDGTTIWWDLESGTAIGSGTLDAGCYSDSDINSDELKIKCDVLSFCITDADTITVDSPCKKVTYEVGCDLDSYIREKVFPDGTHEAVIITNKDTGDSGVIKITTIRYYPDGTYTETERYVDGEGNEVGVKYTDVTGTITYCKDIGCKTDSTYKRYFNHPVETQPCTSLQEVIQETIKTKQDEPPTTDRNPITIQTICPSLSITDDTGHKIYITDQGVAINEDGEVVPTTSTTTQDPYCSQNITTWKADGCSTHEGETITYPDGTTSTTSTWTDPQTGQRKTSATYTKPDGTKVYVGTDGTIMIDGGEGESTPTPGGCVNSWNSLCGQGEICGGTYNPSCHQCQVGSH